MAQCEERVKWSYVEVLTNTHEFASHKSRNLNIEFQLKPKGWHLVFRCVGALDAYLNVNMCVPPAWSALSFPLSWSTPPRGTGSAASGTGSDPGGWNALLTGSWDRIGHVSVLRWVQTEENRRLRLIPSLDAQSTHCLQRICLKKKSTRWMSAITCSYAADSKRHQSQFPNQDLTGKMNTICP